MPMSRHIARPFWWREKGAGAQIEELGEEIVGLKEKFKGDADVVGPGGCQWWYPVRIRSTHAPQLRTARAGAVQQARNIEDGCLECHVPVSVFVFPV